jgi:putative methyltransferase (TIGR04325 family)
MSSLAPVAFFVYKRLLHAHDSLTSLLKNPEASETDLVVFSDGWRNKSDRNEVVSVREYLKNIVGFKSIRIVERPFNFGLSRNITSGVSEVLESYDRVIVIEDDLVSSPFFLRYMNAGLSLYESNPSVASIHAYIYPTAQSLPESFFLRGADCWGWAVWSRSWKYYEPDGEKLLALLKKKRLTGRFDFDGAYPYQQMLLDQIAGKNDSWAVRWYASALLADMYTLYPGRSLVHNIGNDASGTHAAKSDAHDVDLSSTPIKLEAIRVDENSHAYRQFRSYFRRTGSPIARLRLAQIARFGYRFLLQVTPPVLVRFAKRVLRHATGATRVYGFFAFSGTYDEALSKCSGYSSEIILDRTLDAIMKVKRGEARYERDSVVFDHVEHSWPLLSSLLHSAALNNGSLSVVDFGGSLGSSYFQVREFLEGAVTKIRWSVVEQAHYIECGSSNLASDELQFYATVPEALVHQEPQVLLLSSVLPYLPDPFAMIDVLKSYRFKMIIVDRTYFCERSKPLLTIQRVPPAIYPASYPAWFLNEKEFQRRFFPEYELIADFDSYLQAATNVDGIKCFERGAVFRLR